MLRQFFCVDLPVTILICVSGSALTGNGIVAVGDMQDDETAVLIGSGMPVFVGASDDALRL